MAYKLSASASKSGDITISPAKARTISCIDFFTTFTSLKIVKKKCLKHYLYRLNRISSCTRTVFIHLEYNLFYKQTKNRNETGSNLSLGTRLTVLSKRLGRKRCCDATPDRCLGGVPSHYLCFALLKKCGVFFERSRVWAGSQGLKRTN